MADSLNRMTQDVLRETTVRVYCDTCGHLFLEIRGDKFVALHDWNAPDKWFVETGIHWCFHEDHQIIIDYGNGVQQSINEIWENKRKLDNSTREIMLPHFYKYQRQVRNKPI